jgi:hypothetical protein
MGQIRYYLIVFKEANRKRSTVSFHYETEMPIVSANDFLDLRRFIHDTYGTDIDWITITNIQELKA